MEELNNLLAENGLQKIFRVVRSQLQKSKETFLMTVGNRFDPFFSPDEIDRRILTKLWNELQGMKCKYLCPWCGMPCCSTQNCNDLYERWGLPSTVEAKVKHSCHFHRDTAIRGVTELINDKLTDRLFNRGDCPGLIAQGAQLRIQDPENRDKKIYVPLTYYDTTWRIKASEQDPDQGSGYFWQWFLAFVSSESNSIFILRYTKAFGPKAYSK